MKQYVSPEQRRLFEDEKINYTSSSTFLDNLSLPIHRWFRYSAGFSALWVRRLILREREKGRTKILDPFAGSGTVLLESERCNVKSLGIESHPFVSRVTRAKLLWSENSVE